MQLFQLTLLEHLGFIDLVLPLDKLITQQNFEPINLESKTIKFYQENAQCNQLLEKFLNDQTLSKEQKLKLLEEVQDVADIVVNNTVKQLLNEELSLIYKKLIDEWINHKDQQKPILLPILEEALPKDFSQSIHDQIEEVLIKYKSVISNSCTKENSTKIY